MRLLVSALAFGTAGGLALPNYPLPRPPSPSLAQRALDWALASPLYGGVLVPQARRTMVKTAEANAIPWAKSLAWIKGHKAWGAAELAAASDPDTVTPAYYCAPFHAYLPGGNLCWEAAWEQELAGQAVGQRNFPGAGPGGAAAEAARASTTALRTSGLTPSPPPLGNCRLQLSTLAAARARRRVDWLCGSQVAACACWEST